MIHGMEEDTTAIIIMAVITTIIGVAGEATMEITVIILTIIIITIITITTMTPRTNTAKANTMAQDMMDQLFLLPEVKLETQVSKVYQIRVKRKWLIQSQPVPGIMVLKELISQK